MNGYEGQYEVSDLGRVRSLKTDVETGGRVLKLQPYSRYLYAGLWESGKLRYHRVHRLVLTAFVGPCPDGFEGLHGEGGPHDNRISNLKWGTKSENVKQQVTDGTHREARKTECVNGHAFDEANTYVRPDGRGRCCKRCVYLRNKARRVAAQ